MFCPKCGHQVADDAAFCPICGNQLSAPNSQPVYNQPVPIADQQRVYVQRTSAPSLAGIAVVKKLCASPVALVAIIAYTVAAIFSLLASLGGANDISGFLVQVPSMPGVDIDGMIQTMQTSFVVGVIIGILPTALIALGMWLTYASAASKQNSGMSTGGLTLVKTILIIQLVFVCIAIGIVVLAFLVAIAASMGSLYMEPTVGPAGSVGIVAALVLVIAVAFFILLIVYYAKAIKTVNTISMTARTGKLSDNVSMFVAVMAFIAGGISAFAVFNSKTFDVMLSNICSATASISFGVFLCMYRNGMREAMTAGAYTNAPSQPVYAAPTANTYNPQAQDFSAQQSTYYPQSAENDQPTTVLSEEPQQLVTCSSCGQQYGVSQGQVRQCPYCGHLES